MTDCSNAEIRDLLPDYVHDQLSVTDLARVEQHLKSCAECTDELALLQAVFDSRPNVAPVNIAAIVASLPKPGQGNVNRPDILPQREVSFVAQGVRDIASAPSVVRKSSALRNWRAIAAVAVLAVGTFSVAVLRQNFMTGKSAPLSDTTGVVATLPNHEDDSLGVVSSRDIALSVGDVSDYSAEELNAIVSRLEESDGTISADPLPGVPRLPPGS